MSKEITVQRQYLSRVSLARLMDIGCRLIELGGEITDYEQNTYRFYLSQLNKEEQDWISDRYGHILTFLEY